MNDDSTRIMTEGTEDYPLDAALAMSAESCPHCQASIPSGMQFCPKCGYQRGTWGESDATQADDDAPAEISDAPFFLIADDGARYPLVDGETIAGRGDVAIKLADGFVSRRHASFGVVDGVVSITDLGSANGSFIGEEQLAANDAHVLAPGTAVRLGQTTLTLEAAEVAEPAAEETQVLDTPEEAVDDNVKDTTDDADDDATDEIAPLVRAAVEITPAESPWSLTRADDEVIALPYGETRIGRKEAKCDVVISDDGFISGLHCRLIAGEDNLDVTDLGSTNGTHVNHERVAPDQTVSLTAGDTLRVGETELQVAYKEPDNASDDS